MKKSAIIHIFLLTVFFSHAQEENFNSETVIERGILGTYTQKDFLDWYNNINGNIYREDIAIKPSKAEFDQVKKELAKYISEKRLKYIDPAVFYVVPDTSDAIKLHGFIRNDASAYMYLIMPNTILSEIKNFSPETLVFAINGKNDVIWCPLKYFNYILAEENSFTKNLNNEFITTFLCESGICAFRYKPTEEEIEAIGADVYYMNKEIVKNTMDQRNFYKEIYDKAADFQVAEFAGGINEMWKWMSNNLCYPVKAAENNIQGKVIVTFIVQADGKITDVKIKKSLHYICDQEVLRLVASMPKWSPGRLNGVAVESTYTLPVNFKLEGR